MTKDRLDKEVEYLKELIQPSLVVCELLNDNKLSSLVTTSLDNGLDEVRPQWLLIINKWHITATLQINSVELEFNYNHAKQNDTYTIHGFENFEMEFNRLLVEHLEKQFTNVQ